jgi:hypothetical protein
LRFKTEHPIRALPAITDLTTGNATVRVVASFRSDAGIRKFTRAPTACHVCRQALLNRHRFADSAATSCITARFSHRVPFDRWLR